MITRRDLIKTAAIGSVTIGLTGLASMGSNLPAQTAAASPSPEPKAPTGPFTLPPLPYAYNALEPAIDAKTMTIHHDKHHATYIKNANKILADYPDLATKSPEFLVSHLDEIPELIRTSLRNNVGGHLNHSWFWLWLTPNAKPEPTGDLAKALNAEFGSFESFKKTFSTKGAAVFGSGWVWLTVTPDKKLKITSTANQDNPLMEGADKPILGLDVWEHAYYLKHQNVRADYIKDFFTVVNWDQVSKLYAA